MGRKNTLEEIEARLDKTGDCWLWTHPWLDRDGYGKVSYNSKVWLVHRLIYTIYKGEIPEGLILLHSCDTPACANPDHLTPGTHGDNIRDCIQKGRRRKQNGSKNPNAKLTDYQVEAMRGLYALGVSMSKLSLLFNVSRRTVHKIVNGKSWEELVPAVEGVAETWDADREVSSDKLHAIGIQTAQ